MYLFVLPFTVWLYLPADRGIAAAILWCRSFRLSMSMSAWVYWVRTAIIPHPMSTPTAAGMIAPSVGSTLPTVAPLPKWASGIRATCGWMKSILDVSIAWAFALYARIEAQLYSLSLIFSIAI